MNETAIIILAAGESARFGKIKQLQEFNDKTLLQHVIDEATGSGATLIVVVTGSHAEEIQKSIHQTNIDIVFNPDWKNGMASGIVAGVRHIKQRYHGIANIIIAVCDQPFISSSLFDQLMQSSLETQKNIIASTYANTTGTPVLFTRKYFYELFTLQGDEGAKKILKANSDDIATVSFPKGNIDIDTQKDYEALLNHESEE